MTAIKLKCPRCKKKSFTLSKKEDGVKFYYCYLCKYAKSYGGTIINKNVETKGDDEIDSSR